jgi:hypothetical protein
MWSNFRCSCPLVDCSSKAQEAGQLEIDVPPGAYRARWSGHGFPPAGEYVPGESSRDSYRLQLWAAQADEPPRELKRWPGYDLLSG